MRLPRLLALIAAGAVLASSFAWSAPKKKNKKEEVTQVLELPKDPPSAVIADASRLSFHVSPLSTKGLLSQQVRDGLKALLGLVRGAQVVKLRAFVAGSGDVRRVQAIVSEVFTDRRLNIPALTVVQVGGLPVEGAQVVLESMSVEKKDVNPNGLAFLSGRRGPASESIASLSVALGTAGAAPESMRQVTCYLNSLDHLNELRIRLAVVFPKTPATFVQIRRDSAGDTVLCEGIAALQKTPERSPTFVGATHDGMPGVALVGPVRLALTGTQMAFGREEADVKLAFDRLGKALEGVGANWSTVANLDAYPLMTSMSEKVTTLRKSVIEAGRTPAGTMLVFEGLPSLDALLAVDAVAVVAR